MPAAADDTPLTAAEADCLLAPFASASGLVLAVSGGSDSLALLVTVDGWRRRAGFEGPIVVATVDHGLRPQSGAEAVMVAAVAATIGLPHRTQSWEGPRPTTGIEAAAREARYSLLLALAREIGASHVLTAHHLDDQAETVLMRLGRGSGLSGLAGMATERALGDGVTLARPFLAIGKHRLAAVTAAAGLVAAVDESNADPRFARARLRSALPILAPEGINAAGLARTAALLRRANDALEHYVDRFMQASANVDALAVVRIDRAALGHEPMEVRLRILDRVVAGIGGAAWPARTEQAEALAELTVSGRPFRRTIRGAVVAGRGTMLEIYREAGRRPLPTVPIAAGYSGVWDHRFRIVVPRAPNTGLTLGPLGDDGRLAVGLVGAGRATHMMVLPAFRLAERVVAVPPLGLFDDAAKDLRLEAACVLAETLRIERDDAGGSVAQP
ncbi:MAG: tRNA lysidine(34) synthetase TilS [Bauldia sp.]